MIGWTIIPNLTATQKHLLKVKSRSEDTEVCVCDAPQYIYSKCNVHLIFLLISIIF